MQKLLPHIKTAIVGTLSGYILYNQKDNLYKTYHTFQNPTPIKDILSKSDEIFQNNPQFLKQNLISYTITEKNKNETQFSYIPSINSQGHFMISHGGFTASMVEYSARYVLSENERENFVISDFFIKYIKPIYVYREYDIVLLEIKDCENEKKFKVEIWDKKRKQIYCIGDVKFVRK